MGLDAGEDLVELEEVCSECGEGAVAEDAVRVRADEVGLGFNSIDIWNLRLVIGRKLRHWLKPSLNVY